jgi:hypothetical protein
MLTAGGSVTMRRTRALVFLAAAWLLLPSCVIDNGDRPKKGDDTDAALGDTDPGSSSFDCAEDDSYDLLIFDHFEFGAALGTWYANNDICEGCQALQDKLKALTNPDPDAGVEDTDTLSDNVDQISEELEKCREYCQNSQFPTIFDKPLPAGKIPDGGRCGSAYAFHLTTIQLTDWGANWGTKLSPPFDGSDFEGISFWARRAPSSRGVVRVEMADMFTDGEYVDEDGNSYCDAHYTDDSTAKGCDRFGGYVTVGTDWQFFLVPFEDMRQAGWGASAPYFDVAGLRTMTFLFPAGTWDIWVDDVAFYKRQSSN